MEVKIDSLEDMCALMCDNHIPREDKNASKDSRDNNVSDVLLDTRLHHGEVEQMKDCTECKYAEWDYETYYGTTQKQYFVCGCKLDKDAEHCEEDE